MQNYVNYNGHSREPQQLNSYNGYLSHSDSYHHRNQEQMSNYGIFEQTQIAVKRNFQNHDNNNFIVQSMDNELREEERNEGRLFENFGISHEKPKHIQYAVLAVRQSTYRGFPRDINQTPEQLAKAGFFYSGKEDVVYCFFCGQGLKSWEPNDDPWIEHARWAPNCVYLIQMKGKDFVDMVQIAHNNPEQEYPQHEEPMEGLTIETQIVKSQTDSVDSSHHQRTRDLLETIAAQSLLANGYDKDKVEQAIYTYIGLKGADEHFTATDLLQMLFAIEDGTVQPISPKETRIAKPYTKTEDRNNLVSSVKKRNSPVDNEHDLNILRNENQQLKDQTVCKICLEENVSIVFLPCGHLCSCAECAPALRKCPICRTFIKGTVKTFLS